MTIYKLAQTLKQFTFLGTVLVAGSLYTLSANAQPAKQTLKMTVKYADLDLSTAAGVETLYTRIVFASQRVCPSDSMRDLQLVSHAQACRVEAIARAVRAINNPRLAAVHEQSTTHG